MAAVAIERITKRFGDTPVLHGVSLEVSDGAFMTLLGPSGCGKSTLLRIIAGLDTQDSGEVRIDGANVDHCRPKERDVAMVFQSYALYPYMTIRENMALPLVMRRLSARQRLPLVGRFLTGTAATRAGIDARVREVADALAIGGLLERKPAQLSGGQRQRAALGRAMVRDPKVFLMDEPLSNLDAKLRVHMRAELADLHRRLGATFIYVTHDQSEAMTMSDRVAVVMDGRILQVAAPGALYNDPASLTVAEFVGSPKINVVPGIVAASGTVRALDVAIPLAVSAPQGAALRFGIRAEALALGHAPAPGAFAGQVRLVENLGSDGFVHLAVAGLEGPLVARVEGMRADEFRVGATAWAVPRPERVLAFGEAGERLAAGPPAARMRTHG